MSKVDVLKRIKSAESEASDSLESAREKAQVIVSKARVNSSEKIQRSYVDGQAKSQKMLETARVDATANAEKISTEGEKVIEEIHESGNKNRKKAIDVVLDAFIN